MRNRLPAVLRTLTACLLLMAGRGPELAGQGNRFELARVAEGVYVTVQSDPLADPIQGNSTIIINDGDVLVVDANIMPSMTRAVVAEIRRLTDKPVRYVVNTHWHSDHHYGNSVYRDAWPGVEFIAHPATRTAIEQEDLPTVAPNVNEVYPKAVAEIREQLAAGRDRSGAPLTARDSARLRGRQAAFEQAIAEWTGLELVLPTVTVADSLVLHRGSRTIVIRHLGRGNTAGDLTVHLPAERVLVTGDLLVSPVPFAFGSYLGEWIETLGRLRTLPADVIIPGHGAPQRDWAHLDRVTDLLRETLAEVRLAAERGGGLDSVRARVALEPMTALFAGGDERRRRAFASFFVRPSVERAYLEVTGALE